MGKSCEVCLRDATSASIFSTPFINLISMIKKQHIAYFKQNKAQKPIMKIIKDSAAKKYKRLFRGPVPLIGTFTRKCNYLFSRLTTTPEIY